MRWKTLPDGLDKLDAYLHQAEAPESGRTVPLLLFDGDCGFCRGAIEWLTAHASAPVDAVPWQRADLSALGLDAERAGRTVWWIEPDGRKLHSERAVGRALRACDWPWSLIGRLLQVPGLRHLARLGYRGIARIRGHLPGVPP